MIKSILCLLVAVSVVDASRYGLLRIAEFADEAPPASSQEESSLVMEEDFQAFYRQLFGFQHGFFDDSSILLSMGPLLSMSMSMAPVMSMAPLMPMPSYALPAMGISDASSTKQETAALNTQGTGATRSGFKAGFGGLGAAMALVLVAAAVVVFKLKKRTTGALSHQNLANDESSLLSLPTKV